MTRVLFGLTAAALALAAAQDSAAANLTVELSDAPPYMRPLSLRARVGDTVVFHNRGPELVHTISDDGLTLFSADIAVGGQWSYTFKRAGIFPYVCHRHHFMRGTVRVENPDGTTTSAPDFAYQTAFHEYVIPTMQAVPRMIVADRRTSTIWFTEGGGDFYGFENIPANNKIGQLDAHGHIVEFSTPTPGSDGSKVGVDSLVLDEDGSVWFTERLTNRLGRLMADGKMVEIPLPNPKGYALGIDRDARGNIWFAERFANRIGYITPAGRVREIELPGKESEPRTVFVDRRQRVWYTARTANEIGYYDQARKRFVRIAIPTANARPTGIAELRDGSIYFVEMVGNKIARVIDDHVVEYALPTRFAAPFKIVADAEDRLWFTEVFGNALGMMNPATGEIVEYKIPTADSRPGGIAVDAKGHIWFTEQLGNKIGEFVPSELPRDSTPQGRVEDFALPRPGSGPGNDIIEDRTGRLWINELYGNRIAAFDPATGQFDEVSLPTPSSMPSGMAIDRRGDLWVAQFRTNALARVDVGRRQVDEFPLPTDAALPTSVAVDESDNVWLTELAANRIARFDRARGRFEEYELPRPSSSPLHIASDRRGGLWITASEERGNYVARFDVAQRRFEAFDLPTPNCSPVAVLVDGDAVWVTEGGAGKLARLDVPRRSWEEFRIPAHDAEPVRLAKDRRGASGSPMAEASAVSAATESWCSILQRVRSSSFQCAPRAPSRAVSSFPGTEPSGSLSRTLTCYRRSTCEGDSDGHLQHRSGDCAGAGGGNGSPVAY